MVTMMTSQPDGDTCPDQWEPELSDGWPITDGDSSTCASWLIRNVKFLFWYQHSYRPLPSTVKHTRIKVLIAHRRINQTNRSLLIIYRKEKRAENIFAMFSRYVNLAWIWVWHWCHVIHRLSRYHSTNILPVIVRAGDCHNISTESEWWLPSVRR